VTVFVRRLKILYKQTLLIFHLLNSVQLQSIEHIFTKGDRRRTPDDNHRNAMRYNIAAYKQYNTKCQKYTKCRFNVKKTKVDSHEQGEYSTEGISRPKNRITPSEKCEP